MLTPRQLKDLRATAPADAPNRLARAIEITGVTHVQIAAAIGATQSHATEIVNGNYRRLPLETARALAAFFGCPIEDLFPARDERVSA